MREMHFRADFEGNFRGVVLYARSPYMRVYSVHQEMKVGWWSKIFLLVRP